MDIKTIFIIPNWFYVHEQTISWKEHFIIFYEFCIIKQSLSIKKNMQLQM